MQECPFLLISACRGQETIFVFFWKLEQQQRRGLKGKSGNFRVVTHLKTEYSMCTFFLSCIKPFDCFFMLLYSHYIFFQPLFFWKFGRQFMSTFRFIVARYCVNADNCIYQLKNTFVLQFFASVKACLQVAWASDIYATVYILLNTYRYPWNCDICNIWIFRPFDCHTEKKNINFYYKSLAL